MPNRILRDWTDSYHIERLSAEAERLFVRLLMKADDYGRYHDDPRLIKGSCFPLLCLTDDQVLVWIAECAKAEVIKVYEVGKRKYLAIVEFKQRLHEGARPKFPCPVGETEPWLPTYSGLPELPASYGGFQRIPASRARAGASNTNTNTTSSSGDWGEGERGVYPGIPSSEAEAISWASMENVPSSYASEIFQDCQSVGWKDGVNRQIVCWRSYVKKRWSKSQKAKESAGGYFSPIESGE